MYRRDPQNAIFSTVCSYHNFDTCSAGSWQKQSARKCVAKCVHDRI